MFEQCKHSIGKRDRLMWMAHANAGDCESDRTVDRIFFSVNDFEKRKHSKSHLWMVWVGRCAISGENNCTRKMRSHYEFCNVLTEVAVLINTETKGDQLSECTWAWANTRERTRREKSEANQRLLLSVWIVHVRWLHPHRRYTESWIAVGSPQHRIIDRFELLYAARCSVHASAFSSFFPMLLQLFALFALSLLYNFICWNWAQPRSCPIQYAIHLHFISLKAFSNRSGQLSK